MFLSSKRVHEIVELAREDVYAYLYALFTFERHGDLDVAIRQVVDAGPTIGFAPVAVGAEVSAPERYFARLMDLLEFLEKSDRTPVAGDWFPAVVDLLKHFEQQMRRFAASESAGTRRAELAVEVRSSFARFVCQRIGCQVQIYEMESEWFAPHGLVSWLLVRCNNPTQLHIVYDRAKIDESTVDPVAREQRYEKIFLHELGHARLHNDFLRERAQGGPDDHIHVLPVHEVEAFVYAFTVRGLMLGMLSRVNRLLGSEDLTWKMQ